MNVLPPATYRQPLDPAQLAAALLPPRGAYARVEVVDSTGSTNADVAAEASAGAWPDISVLIANAQEAGKGRLGRDWVIPAGAAMISSVFLRPTAFPGPTAHSGPGVSATGVPEIGVPESGFAATGYAWLSIVAGIALCEALWEQTQIPVTLKWPNDVVVNGRKLAGILAQLVPARPHTQNSAAIPAEAAARAPAQAGTPAEAGPGVVVGVGANVGALARDLPTDRATSLLMEGASGAGLDRNVLLPAYLNKFASLYRDFVAVGGDALVSLGGGPSLLERTSARMSTLGQEVRAELPGGAMLSGTATGLGADGGLEITTADGHIRIVSAGDVIHLRRTDTGRDAAYA